MNNNRIFSIGRYPKRDDSKEILASISNRRTEIPSTEIGKSIYSLLVVTLQSKILKSFNDSKNPSKYGDL